jgi:hypothetical protein
MVWMGANDRRAVFPASENDISAPSCVFRTRICNNQPFQPSATQVSNLFTMEEQKKKSEVSPATTLPWPYSRCSDDNYADNDKTTPPRNNDVP